MPSPKSLPTALLGLALACPALAHAEGLELGQVLIDAPGLEGADQSVAEAEARLAQVPGGQQCGRYASAVAGSGGKQSGCAGLPAGGLCAVGG